MYAPKIEPVETTLVEARDEADVDEALRQHPERAWFSLTVDDPTPDDVRITPIGHVAEEALPTIRLLLDAS